MQETVGLSIALTDEVLTAITRDQTAQAQKRDLAIEAAPPPTLWCSKDRQYSGVAVEVMSCDLATGEKANQRHVTQGVPHHLHLGMPRAEVLAAASRATDINRAAMCRAALQFVADFRRDAHQIELCGFRVARAKSQTHAMLDLLGDRQGLVLPVYAHQVPHHGIRAELSGPSRHVLVAVIKPTSVADSAWVNS
jgi:hypothetical protein